MIVKARASFIYYKVGQLMLLLWWWWWYNVCVYIATWVAVSIGYISPWPSSSQQRWIVLRWQSTSMSPPLWALKTVWGASRLVIQPPSLPSFPLSWPLLLWNRYGICDLLLTNTSFLRVVNYYWHSSINSDNKLIIVTPATKIRTKVSHQNIIITLSNYSSRYFNHLIKKM